MNKLKYTIINKFEPSEHHLKNSKNINSFIRNIRKEALLRKIVEIDGKIIIFGVEGPILLQSGKFWYISAEIKDGIWGKHHILISPDLKNIIKRGNSFIRLDSGCLSGILGDNTCDCMDQLRIAEDIALQKGGIIIHIPNQDGRGWQEYKMAHQRIIHETKLDTITVANKFLKDKDPIDIRTFDESAFILKAMGFPTGYKFNLGTKNPKKVTALVNAGFQISTHSITSNIKSKILNKNLKAKDKFFQRQTRCKKHAGNKER
jgi:GTP cyclohydrolase II